MPPGFLTVNQILERIPVSRRTLGNHIRAGKIPVIKLGHRTLFDWPCVRDSLIRQQRT